MLSVRTVRCAWLFLLLWAGGVLAFDLNVKSSVSASQVFIGDRFTYRIAVDAPAAARVDLPSFVGNLGSFEVKDMKNERVIEGMPEGRARFVWTATLNTFVGGDFMIAPQEVDAVLGKDTVKTHTDPVAIRVTARTTGQETDIMDVEAPLKDPRMPVWFWWTIGILGAVLLVVLGWFLHKRFRRDREEFQLPPYEEAVLALKKLRERNPLAGGDQADYFASVSFIARRYVQRRFNVDILDATITQLKQRMSQVSGLQQAYKESVVSLEVETEPVKFAKMKLPVERCDFWGAWVDRLLEDTKPLPEETKNQSAAKNPGAESQKKNPGPEKRDSGMQEKDASAESSAETMPPEPETGKGGR